MTHKRGLPIITKLYLIVGLMAVLIVVELMTLRFSMGKLSAVRAFVEGEGSWSKAQKNAALSLQRYTHTHDEKDYDAFLEYLKIPEGDHRARVELEKPKPDLEAVRQGFLQGHIHPDDIGPMINLLQNFSWVRYLNRAVTIWGQGDVLLFQFKDAGNDYRNALRAQPPDRRRMDQSLERILTLNRGLTELEENFSHSLGEGSRWMERVVISLLSLAVLMVESVGLTLTFRTSRRISKGLAELNGAAERMGHGDFGHSLIILSHDEIGTLAESINQMGQLLEKAYKGLETRVHERTAELEKMVIENARLYDDARSALDIRDEFLSIASHELKTPVSSLYLQLQLLERVSRRPEGLGTTKARETLDRAVEQVRKLTGLIEELLDLTRIRTGKMSLARERCDLGKVVSEVVSQLAIQASRSGSSISLHCDSPVVGWFDPTRMSQVVTNILSNSIKYGNGKPVDVILSSEGGWARLEVRDQGIGIAHDKQSRLFQRFERALDSTGISGLGLGLYITRQILEAHEGSISVESDLDKGARFVASFPLSLDSAKEEPYPS